LDDEGNEFIIYSNIDRWEKYLIELAPEDKASIQRMCTDMRKSALLEPFALAPELRSPLDYIKILPQMLPILNVIRKFGRMTCGEYFEKLNFKSKRIKSVFFSLYGNRDFSALAFIFMLGWYHQKNAGYIKGGSYPLAQRMVEKFGKLGGTITYKKKVVKVIVENNVAKGVLLTDGTTIQADYVISAADGYSTIFKMLDAKYMSKEIDFAYKNWELFTPIVQVSFGINKAIPSESPIIINISKDKLIGKTALENGYSVMNYSFDTTMAPAGKTTIILRFDSPWKLWENMDEKEYKAEKLQIKKDATDHLEKEYPGITEFIEVIDVATPKTDVSYTGVKDGAYEGFMPSKDNMMKSLKMQLPNLQNFYMAGQWLFPGGGLPPSAQTGKWAVQLICKKEKQKFISNK
jgi:phytoene dehydrogenase-like protein